MNKILTFKVGIEGLEDKIWRKIEISDRMTVADLAYTILATFESFAYHLYKVKYKGYIFDSWMYPLSRPDYNKLTNAVITELSELNLKKNDKLEMEYDFGSPTTFKITYLGQKNVDVFDAYLYPAIIDGAGYGMIDDICDFELQDIVDDIDNKGYSDYYFIHKDEIFDYREFNLKENNKKLKGLILQIKNGYEIHGK